MFNSWEVLQIPNGQAGIEATLEQMAMLVRDAQTDPITRTTALGLLNRSRSRTIAMGVRMAELFVRRTLQLINEPVELLQPPAWLLSQAAAGIPTWGDCDDAAMLVAALILAMGVPVRFHAVWPVDIGGDGHVFTEALDGRFWRRADPTTTLTVPPGWASLVWDI